MSVLKGKVALITGASKGIGRAAAMRLAQDGARIAGCATGTDLLAELKERIESTGAACMVRQCDVADWHSCEQLVRSVREHYGRIDILVNNAGIGFSGKVVDLEPEDAEQMVRINILGVYHMARAVLPGMIEQSSGDIVNIGSVAGLKYSPGFALYSATKFAVRAFSEGLRNEAQPHNVRVITVHPGMTNTNFFDLFTRNGSPLPVEKDRLLKAEDIAETIHFALTRPDAVGLNELTVRPAWQER